ncbi:MAG: DNA primase [Methanobacteriota archaeon]|nr:MAG: DNA primase [Euryarchaeota archaeon]
MGKTYIDTVKYTVYADFIVSGLVEKPDVVGAVFGQTEGLLGEDLDLRELQKNGRIGRIEVEVATEKGKTKGVIKIPSSLDMVETAIIAAALETVDRVGPCEAKIEVKKIEDNRNQKRKKIIDTAKSLLKRLIETQIPESREITDMVRKEVKASGVVFYGPEKLPAGPGIELADSVILVEGRADVINLLKNDVTNVIAIGGAKVPKSLVELSKKKEITVFLDGDRGGDIILKELLNGGTEIDYVARAPRGREVEELTRKELIKALRNKAPVNQEVGPSINQAEEKKNGKNSDKKKKREEKKEKEEVDDSPVEFSEEMFKEEIGSLKGRLKARFYNRDKEVIKEVSVREMLPTLQKIEGVKAIVFDGIITQRLADIAKSKGVAYVVGIKIGNINKKPEGMKLIAMS